jgi:hypothetical protein
MPLTSEQLSFLNRFLGTDVGTASDDNTSDEAADVDVMAIWRKAKESTDQSIANLQKALKSYSHPDLDRIADAGLNGITDTNQTGIMRALIEYSAAPAHKKESASAKLVAQTDAYASFLENSALINLAEQNPFGVRVEIRRPLLATLTKIARIAA